MKVRCIALRRVKLNHMEVQRAAVTVVVAPCCSVMLAD
jgi:hypothetical protein